MQYVILHPEETYEKIKAYEYREGKKYDIKSIKNLLTAILSYYKGEDGLIPCDLQPYREQYKRYFDEAKGKVEAFYDKNEPTEKQKKGVVDWNDIIQAREQLAKREYGSRRHVLMSMYTYLPPMRQDLNEVKILTKTPKNMDGNYIILNARVAKLVLNEYKTVKAYGRFDTSLPKELTKIIKDSLKIQPREYLITDTEGKPYTDDKSFAKFSNRTLKETLNNDAVSVSMLRHSYISSQDYNKMTEGDRKELARQMMHSVAQQGQYRHIVD